MGWCCISVCIWVMMLLICGMMNCLSGCEYGMGMLGIVSCCMGVCNVMVLRFFVMMVVILFDRLKFR